MNCTRCKRKLRPGQNCPRHWHLPMCFTCRHKVLENPDYNLTRREKSIMQERFEIDRYMEEHREVKIYKEGGSKK